MKIYVDTNIYLDYLLERKNKQGKDLGTPAYNIFKRALNCEFHIIISKHLIQELRGIINTNDLTMLMSFLKHKLIKVEDETDDKGDAPHAYLAIKYGAEIIVTRNKTHFKNYSIQANTPEEL